VTLIISRPTGGKLVMPSASYSDIVTGGMIMNLDAGSRLSYSGSGTTWNDISGRGNNGTLTNGPTYSSANGGSIVFDGTNDFVLHTTSNGFGTANLPAAASLEIWANVTRKGGGSFAYQKLAGFRNDSNFDFYVLILDDSGATVLTEARIRTSTTVTEIYADFPISYFGKWTHIVFTANVNRADLYLNGVLVGSNTSLTGSFPATSGNFNVGKNPLQGAGTGQSWQTKGNISSVRFYNRALSAAEVSQNFNALVGRVASALIAGLAGKFFNGSWRATIADGNIGTLPLTTTNDSSNVTGTTGLPSAAHRYGVNLWPSIAFGNNIGESYGFIAIGYFTPPTTGTYTIFTSSDDYSGVWIGDLALAGATRTSANATLNNGMDLGSGGQANTKRSGTIALTGGVRYPIRIVMEEANGGDNLTFSWSGPGISETTDLLTYFSTPTSDGVLTGNYL